MARLGAQCGRKRIQFFALDSTTAAPENLANDVVPGGVLPVQLVAVLKSVVPPALFQTIVCAAIGAKARERYIRVRAKAPKERKTNLGRAGKWGAFT